MKLSLEESGVLTVCEITTVDIDDDDNVRPLLYTYSLHIMTLIRCVIMLICVYYVYDSRRCSHRSNRVQKFLRLFSSLSLLKML